MHKFFPILLVLISIATGAIFVFSAYTKSYSIQSFESFELAIVEYTHLPWLIAAFLSRFFIGLESAIGAMLILHIYGKNKWVLKLAVGMLIVFSIYLIYLWIIAGNDINCGCFGDEYFMAPSASLIKNIVLLALLWLLLRFQSQLPFRYGNIVSVLGIIIITYMPFSYFHVSANTKWLKENHYKIDISVLYNKYDTATINLRHGKYIVAFFNPNCHHCQMAAYKMHLMKENNPSLPFFMVIGGSKDLTTFWAKTKAQNIPFTRLDQKNFIKLSGTSWPVIDWVDNGWVEAQSTYVSLNQTDIENWLK